MKKLLFLILLLIHSSWFFTSCKKDNGVAPELPPLESMIIDFSNFESGKKSTELFSEIKGVENSSWEFAATVAGYWRSIITLSLAVPITSFKLAVDNDPVFIGNNTWQWSYNANIIVNQVSVTYKTRLTGEIKETDVLWKMNVSKEGTGAFTEFVWFEGTTAIDGTGGEWTFNHSSQYPEALLKIVWTKSGTSVGTIKYTYMREKNNSRTSDPFKDSYIEYSETNASLNAKYLIHYFNGLSFSDVEVQWNRTSHNGKLKAPTYFGNTNWYCWNEQLINVTCP
jgi:hypothetical protein